MLFISKYIYINIRKCINPKSGLNPNVNVACAKHNCLRFTDYTYIYIGIYTFFFKRTCSMLYTIYIVLCLCNPWIPFLDWNTQAFDFESVQNGIGSFEGKHPVLIFFFFSNLNAGAIFSHAYI